MSTSRTTTAIAIAVGTAVGSAVLTACGTAGNAESPSPVGVDDADRLQRQAQPYVGDPWERRYRAQFWADQHVHDSWNRCHRGENVPRSLLEAPGC